ncbi:MAG: DUF1292 domain-containing protein [Oscillospiraceae bacterium]|jgi:hypothetical protein|nr:DUF1292 domain-containing protein [Oscillospiraceae bacterium]
MSDEYGSNFVSISDEEGNEYELEHLDTIEYGDDLYMAFLPTEPDENGNQPTEMIILKVVEENGEEFFETIDDEDLLDKVYEAFMEQLFDDDAEDDE